MCINRLRSQLASLCIVQYCTCYCCLAGPARGVRRSTRAQIPLIMLSHCAAQELWWYCCVLLGPSRLSLCHPAPHQCQAHGAAGRDRRWQIGPNTSPALLHGAPWPRRRPHLLPNGRGALTGLWQRPWTLPTLSPLSHVLLSLLNSNKCCALTPPR